MLQLVKSPWIWTFLIDVGWWVAVITLELKFRGCMSWILARSSNILIKIFCEFCQSCQTSGRLVPQLGHSCFRCYKMSNRKDGENMLNTSCIWLCYVLKVCIILSVLLLYCRSDIKNHVFSVTLSYRIMTCSLSWCEPTYSLQNWASLAESLSQELKTYKKFERIVVRAIRMLGR